MTTGQITPISYDFEQFPTGDLSHYDLHFKNAFQMYHFNFKTLEESIQLSTYIAAFFPEEKRLCIELGLNELFFNAIEHGNLGITFAEKSKLKEENQWYEEIQRRLNHPFNQNK